MGFVGGDIKTISLSHKVHGTLVLKAKAAEDNTVELGGVRGNDDKQSVTGTGESIRTLNNSGWRAKASIAWDMRVNLELQTLVKMAGDPEECDVMITFLNGSIYGGKGAPLGDLEANVNNVTVPLVLGGGGELKRLA